jgi:hypothetical protein
MARETSYFVQAFIAGRGGNLKADTLSKLGVIAFSSTADPEMGDYDDEPMVIFRKGALPPAFD